MNDTGFDLGRLAHLFVRFAETECAAEPLYDALCRHAATRPALLAWLEAAPPGQRRPNLLLAAVHERVLAGSTHALAAYFPSVGGRRGVDAALPGVVDDFCALHAVELRAAIATRSTQTNEIGRCAVLWPMLVHLAAASGRTRLALLDLGCSAGLNLGVDAWSYVVGDEPCGAADDPAAPTIACRLVGRHRPALQAPRPAIVARLGIDPAPVDIADETALRWLRACLWPHDTARRERFDRAVALARRHRWPVRREGDCTAAAARWVAAQSADVLPVVFNSWVLTYFTADALARHVEVLRRLVQDHGAAWISAEEPRLRIGDETVPPLPDDADAETRHATLWTLMRRGPGGAPQAQVLARSHPHGKWLEWFG